MTQLYLALASTCKDEIIASEPRWENLNRSKWKVFISDVKFYIDAVFVVDRLQHFYSSKTTVVSSQDPKVIELQRTAQRSINHKRLVRIISFLVLEIDINGLFTWFHHNKFLLVKPYMLYCVWHSATVSSFCVRISLKLLYFFLHINKLSLIDHLILQSLLQGIIELFLFHNAILCVFFGLRRVELFLSYCVLEADLLKFGF